MSRATMRVTDLRDAVNRMLATPDSTLTATDPQSFRLGVCSLLEFTLHATGNYRGFAYQDSELLPDGSLRPDHDDTRRRYS